MIKSPKNIFIALIVSMLSVWYIAAPVSFAANAGQVGSWNSTSTLPSNKSLGGMAIHNGRVYIMGGWHGSGGTDTVNYATLNANGTVGTWATSPSTLPQNVRGNSGATYNGYLYSVGGLTDSSERLDTVSYAAVQNDGSVGTWTTSSNTLPTTIQQAATFTHNGYLYVIGGFNVSALSTIYYAPLGDDGSIGSWSTNPIPLPSERWDGKIAFYNGRIYLVGGRALDTTTTVKTYIASINPDHTIGDWAVSDSWLPVAKAGHNIAAANGYLYLMGGTTVVLGTTDVYQARIKSDGDIGAWTVSSNLLPSARTFGHGFAYNNFLYMIGGEDTSNNPQNSVFFAPVTAASTTATLTSPVSGKPIIVSTPDGTDLTCSSATSEASLSAQDTSNDFPVGLVSFCYTTNAPSNQVTITFVNNLSPSQVSLRHFNSTTNTYSTVTGASFSSTTHNGEPAVQATYTIVDNGPYDTDPAVGSVSDPVGLVATPSAPNTGVSSQSLLVPALALIIGLGVILHETKKTLRTQKAKNL
jgi:N-acetylneuraminic acid mutarotase